MCVYTCVYRFRVENGFVNMCMCVCVCVCVCVSWWIYNFHQEIIQFGAFLVQKKINFYKIEKR